MASIFDKSLKGITMQHHKNTKDISTQVMPVPDEVRIVMSQHMGVPGEVKVAKNDYVKVGQLLGDTDKLFSSPVHSSASGTVVRIDEIAMPNGTRSKAVVIQTDKKQELHESIVPPKVDSRESFITAVKESGIVGLGGAGFPSHIKLSPKNPQNIDTLVINAAECEPYITSDYRTIMERGGDIIEGIEHVMKHMNIAKCSIGVEDNKPEAISLLTVLCMEKKNVRVVQLKSKYPQGAEKVLIYESTGRVVPEGKLPSDVGVIVFNVTTVASIAKYLRDGIPLTSKCLTVDGGAVTTPKNVLALIGTPIREVIEFCGGYKSPPAKILMGGPMMGTAVYDENYPIIKNNNAILVLDHSQVHDVEQSACIRCGRCTRSCPMNLMPMRIEDCFLRGDNDGLISAKVNLCMECGCCSHACPANRQLVHVHRLAKARLRAVPR